MWTRTHFINRSHETLHLRRKRNKVSHDMRCLKGDYFVESFSACSQEPQFPHSIVHPHCQTPILGHPTICDRKLINPLHTLCSLRGGRLRQSHCRTQPWRTRHPPLCCPLGIPTATTAPHQPQRGWTQHVPHGYSVQLLALLRLRLRLGLRRLRA